MKNNLDDCYDRQICMEVRTLEWMEAHRPDQLSTPKRPGYMEMIWIKEGIGTCMIDLEQRTIENDEIYFIGARQFRHIQTEGHLEGYYLSFAPAFVKPFLDRPYLSFYPTTHGMDVKTNTLLRDDESRLQIEQLIFKMIAEFNRPNKLDIELLQGLLIVTMMYLKRYLEDRHASTLYCKNQRILNRFFLLLDKYLNTNKMVTDYAADLGISSSHLSAIIKNETGYPATFHIQERKLLEAKRQIVWDGKSMKEVAYNLGFNDPSHFSKFFKAKAGINYQHFKQQTRDLG